MAMAISAGVRNALNSLSSIGSSAQEAQTRLATGKRVNSAVDNAVNFFTSNSLNNRASQFGNLLDGIGNGIKTIQAASKGLDAITKLVQSAQSTIKQAQGDISSRPVIAGTTAIGTAGSVTASGKTMKEVTLATELGGTLGDATASASQKLGIAGAEITLTIKSGETTYTDTALTATSTIQDVVDSVNKSGVATASVGDDGKLTIKSTTSDKLQVGLGSGATEAAWL